MSDEIFDGRVKLFQAKSRIDETCHIGISNFCVTLWRPRFTNANSCRVSIKRFLASNSGFAVSIEPCATHSNIVPPICLNETTSGCDFLRAIIYDRPT